MNTATKCGVFGVMTVVCWYFGVVGENFPIFLLGLVASWLLGWNIGALLHERKEKKNV